MKIRPLPLSSRKATVGRTRNPSWTNELTIEPHGSPVDRGNRNCFFTRFVVKRHGYGAKGIGAVYVHIREFERVGRDFSVVCGVFRSPEWPEGESASRERRNAAHGRAGESERSDEWNIGSATTRQDRRNRRSSRNSR